MGMVTPVSFNGFALNTDDYFTTLTGAFDGDKAITLNDIMDDGQDFGRSKHKEKTLTINIMVRQYDMALISALAVLKIGNKLKPLVVDIKSIGRVVGYAELQNWVQNADTPILISCQLTMPDPHWYTLQPDMLSLEPSITNGVIFGDVTRVQLDAGASDAAARTVFDAAGSDSGTRTVLDGGGSN